MTHFIPFRKLMVDLQSINSEQIFVLKMQNQFAYVKLILQRDFKKCFNYNDFFTISEPDSGIISPRLLVCRETLCSVRGKSVRKDRRQSALLRRANPTTREQVRGGSAVLQSMAKGSCIFLSKEAIYLRQTTPQKLHRFLVFT